MIEFRYETTDLPDWSGKVERDITYRTDAALLDCLLEDFANFLRGIGYVFDGTLEVVEDEDENNDD